MNRTSKLTIKTALKRGLRRFARREDGAMTFLVIAFLFIMLMVGGISVDLMTNEMERTRVQGTMDRAVLAAADLDQTLDAEAVVKDYMQKSGLGHYAIEVKPDSGLNYKSVTVTANGSTPAPYMRSLGTSSLPIPVRSVAEERISNVEISMVLDISGSMRQNSKTENLERAANKFLDTVLTADTTDLVSVSLVPYTAQVSAGPDIFKAMNIPRWSSNPGWCVDFADTDFDTTTLRTDGSYEHMQFFSEAKFAPTVSRAVNNPGCPGRDDGIDTKRGERGFEQIIAHSQNKTALQGRISQYYGRTSTSIHIGMKWGVALLDPSFNTVMQKLNLESKIDPAFAARPATYKTLGAESTTLKTIVLMTDGKNAETFRIHPSKYNQSRSQRMEWTTKNLEWYLNTYVPGNHEEWWYQKYDRGQADILLDKICTAAKLQGIVIWSIGFEVDDDSVDVLRNCASTPSHFFRTAGTEIEGVFSTIASQINQLRLTQ